MSDSIYLQRLDSDAIDARVFTDDEGFTYQDAGGYRSFKTLSGLNKHLMKQATMQNKKAIQFEDASLHWPPADTSMISRADWVH